ncbi:MAG TPA: amidohydrolase family protein [Casimicrobiaceae bacterium]|nr:amidohydrolase family protein [Casimicrobiaceae bacterium]
MTTEGAGQRFDALLTDALLANGAVVSIGIAAGRIAAIDAALPAARDQVSLRGSLVLPGFVDAHVHLDKSLIGDAWQPHRAGRSPTFSVMERVAIESEILGHAAPVEQRAAALIELAVAQGTTHMRSHVDIDPVTGLASLHAVLTVRERYKHVVSIEIVAFPQRGLVSCPGTYELMDAAMREGADLVGGLDPSGVDHDVDGQLDAVFGLAQRHSAGIDIHLHDPATEGLAELDEIARRAKSLGMAGRVNVSHAYALGMVPKADAQRTAENLADAGVSILTNAPGNHPYPSLMQLREAGVTVIAGNDNIRDAWWPYGDADMLERAMLIAYGSGFLTDQELAIALDLATHSAARALGVDDYGVHVGAQADLTVVPSRNVAEAVVARPVRSHVFKAGRLVASDGTFIAR